MNLKRFIPNKLKQEGKYLLYKLAKVPYNREGVPLEILDWLPNTHPITFIDIGAAIGNFSIRISNHYKVNRAVLIEPVPYCMPILERQFSHKGIYSILNLAVSEKEGTIDFYISEGSEFVSSLLKLREDFNDISNLNFNEPHKTVVETKTLDQIIQTENLDVIDLLKVDVQGAEHLVLSGGTNALKKTKLVYTEFSFKPMYTGSSIFIDIFKIMNDNNFRMVSISEGFKDIKGELLQGDALFVNNLLL
jgi:FkbM family methyltransferase